ncbi:MAG: hypothetical protein K2O78_01055, partial [Muribaculaceae bacterium]|nr:hypothetical protein [Muribaculaceae bacterium]
LLYLVNIPISVFVTLMAAQPGPVWLWLRTKAYGLPQMLKSLIATSVSAGMTRVQAARSTGFHLQVMLT